MASKFLISVDLGGTKILSALINSKNEIVDTVKVPTNILKGKTQLVKTIADSVNGMIGKNGVKQEQIIAVSMGVPGTVNPSTGIIYNAPNLKLKNFNIKRAMQKYFTVPVLIENDVNLAALGIQKFEFKNKIKNMLVVFVGTGIGGALIFDNKLYRGSSYFAGEIGHIKVNGNGFFNIPKKNSTFENLASRTAIVKAIKKDLKFNPENPLAKLKKKQIKSKVLANALANDNRVVKFHLENACKVIGSVLGSLTTLLNFDTIVLGGGVMEAMGETLLPKVINSFNHAVIPEAKNKVKIVTTKLGDDAPLFGGIALADEFLK